jgi:hypothetical protein
MKQLFRFIDVDSSGAISCDEFLEFLDSSAGVGKTREQQEAEIRAVSALHCTQSLLEADTYAASSLPVAAHHHHAAGALPCVVWAHTRPSTRGLYI